MRYVRADTTHQWRAWNDWHKRQSFEKTASIHLSGMHEQKLGQKVRCKEESANDLDLSTGQPDETIICQEDSHLHISGGL